MASAERSEGASNGFMKGTRVRHPAHGLGTVVHTHERDYEVRFDHGILYRVTGDTLEQVNEESD